MASRIEWHLPVQEEADWLRLLLFENIQQTLLLSIPHQQNLVVHAPLLIV